MLRIEGLTRRLGGNIVLAGVDLEVPAGKVACIVGPSGCGKSTLLRLVAGLDRPDGGSIRFGERLLSSPGEMVEPHRRGLNMVFQDYALWPHMSVENIVGYGLHKMASIERAKRVSGLLDLMQIGHLAKRLPSQISGGQQQRVAIARALATDPDLLLFDEPLSNLDVQLRLEMRKEFSVLFGAVGKTALYVTHDPSEAAAFADILVVMNAGRIEQVGSPHELFTTPHSPWIATLAGYDTQLAATVIGRDESGAILADLHGQGFRLAGASAAAASEVTPGQPLMVMLVSDDVMVGEPDEGVNALRGKVSHSLFEGRHWRTVVEVGGSSVSASSKARVPVGSVATVSFPIAAAVAFPLTDRP